MDITAVPYSDLDLAAVHAVRQQAWQDKYPKFAAHIAAWEDDFEHTALHLLARIDGKLVGVSRFNQSSTSDLAAQFGHAEEMADFIRLQTPPIGVISRLSVAPAARGLGVARALDEARIAEARKSNCTSIICEVKAGAHRAKALAALGFEPITGVPAYSAYPFPHLRTAPARICEPLCLRLAID